MPESLRLIQFSDCHLFADGDKTGYADINPSASLREVVARIAQDSPDLLLLTGDISGDYSVESYQRLQSIWQQSKIVAPLLSLPGNHDDIGLWQTAFAEMQTLSSHILNEFWAIHRLPSTFDRANGRVCETALRRLTEHLLVDQQRQHIVVLHHPPQDSFVWMDKHRLFNPESLHAMLKRVNNTPLLLHGHVHTARTTKIANTTILACPSTCWQWGNTPDFSVSDTPPGYRIIDLQPQGKWHTDVVYC
ncbi:metallophosphoesterase [Alteromonas sp. ASW11-36]|uniref:Metallophosphoesterase n=1 Tax=Alteromonas arenosi TaxID=3055817 RepID=A0ABT7SZT5_9ALTE|nr:metallophosphoesterase [Alteromonas sp. ASW11-36]MDM7861699.1 metallophosphoesterase [Alteromonas sp. ASW11-36]